MKLQGNQATVKASYEWRKPFQSIQEVIDCTTGRLYQNRPQEGICIVLHQWIIRKRRMEETGIEIYV